MKLLRYGPAGSERPGIVDQQGSIRSLSSVVPDIDSDMLAGGGIDLLRSINISGLPLVEPGRIGACVGKVSKFICIGLNYTDHATEANLALPTEPIIFQKAVSAICGPNDDIEIPRSASRVDWEVELGIVIGKEAKYVTEAKALNHVAGYCVVNDLSEREFQMHRQGQWTKGKSHDTFGPIGPWLVTADEAVGIEDRGIWLSVNGAPRQHSSTGKMVFKPAFLISYVSQFMTLKPGDVLATGTPAGVGLGMNPPKYLQEGDVVTLGVEGLGEQRQLCRRVQ
ncbi:MULTISPECIES: fumarylacetoacetate hydrolase family protein [unclassified Mesorhizobium]|uniref:fumarylacetoacetate hydrolase family protein n=1 Tax=unclassified Mesorhizobium TaxID=325217 RepID=UPI000FD79BCF|nr:MULTISPECIES: fumarylacetoacetate hydrolase family protein [unclassified Mesorhizobium]TGT71905.1 FAA hydrolase family protein [Mesorhizobium sp. M2E.F.Ca.ET.166.01.1.1]TGV99380.1 FAA hydrolase family protein [Mesorhizobium sp. M2E.F.Ca.ET.154.01.1.1]